MTLVEHVLLELRLFGLNPSQPIVNIMGPARGFVLAFIVERAINHAKNRIAKYNRIEHLPDINTTAYTQASDLMAGLNETIEYFEKLVDLKFNAPFAVRMPEYIEHVNHYKELWNEICG